MTARLSMRRALITLSTGTAVGQAAVVLGSPVLSRLYPPAEFGTGATAAAVIAVGSATACLSADQFVHASEDADERVDYIRLGLRANLIVSCVLAVGLTGFVRPTSLTDALLVITTAVAVYAGARYTLGSQLAVIDGSFSSLARRNAVQGVSQSGSQIAFGAISPTAASLSTGQALSRVISAVQFQPFVRRALDAKGTGVGRKVSSVPMLVASASTLLAAGSLQLPVLLSSATYGSGSAGLVALSQRVLALPMTLVGGAMGQTFLHQMGVARERSPGGGPALLRRYLRVLVPGAVVIALVLALVAPLTFAFVFGSEWGPAGDIARVNALAVGSQFVSSPLSVALVPLGYERRLFTILCGRVAAGVAIFLGGSALGAGIVTTMLVYSVALAALNGAIVVQVRRAFRDV